MNSVYQESLPCGGTLKMYKDTWEIEYYFPGPDRRYNGTKANLPGSQLGLYAKAYEENWATYEKLKQALPQGGTLQKSGKMGMTIYIGGHFDGVCLRMYHMPVKTRQHLDVILESYRFAEERAKALRELLSTL